MPGKSKSKSRKAREWSQAADAVMEWAVAAYQVELAKPPGMKQRSARTVYINFMQLYFDETGKHIKLVYSTLIK